MFFRHHRTLITTIVLLLGICATISFWSLARQKVAAPPEADTPRELKDAVIGSWQCPANTGEWLDGEWGRTRLEWTFRGDGTLDSAVYILDGAEGGGSGAPLLDTVLSRIVPQPQPLPEVMHVTFTYALDQGVLTMSEDRRDETAKCRIEDGKLIIEMTGPNEKPYIFSRRRE